MFDICCSLSAILIGFKVYVGQEDDSDNTNLVICDDLMKEDGLTSIIRRTLYNDKYYTLMAIVKHMFSEYVWKTVDTILPTDKKSSSDHDIPFLEFSNSARNGLQQGWYPEAVIKLNPMTGKAYNIQCTSWRNKKRVCF